jgi:hypothetical protein
MGDEQVLVDQLRPSVVQPAQVRGWRSGLGGELPLRTGQNFTVAPADCLL